MLPHLVTTQHVIYFLALHTSAGRHLFCNRELVRTGITSPFVVARLGGYHE